MKSSLSEHFRRDGQPKKAFPSKDSANAAKNLSNAVDMHAYKCSHCPAWHLGHTPQSRRRTKKRR